MRVYEIFDQGAFETKLKNLAKTYEERHGHVLWYDVKDEIRRFREYRPKLAGFCVDAVHLVQNMQKHNVKFLVEGVDALMLDVNYGTYPGKSHSIDRKHHPLLSLTEPCYRRFNSSPMLELSSTS